mgnify:CR=1 FL=1
MQAGADVIQIFDSWAGLLGKEEYDEFILRPNTVINKRIKEYSKETMIINFPRGSKTKYLDFVKEVECDVISIDESCPKEILEISKKKKYCDSGRFKSEGFGFRRRKT